jgi:hypothetical protein
VEAKFDVATLYENFQNSFNSTSIPQEWRDPCLAKPVFAAVQLERQKLQVDGSWSNWETVPRTRIDPYKQILEVIEDVDKLPPGGIKVRLLQFENPQLRMDLLQPKAYRIASAEKQWYPPSLYKKFMKYQSVLKAQERREELEAKRQEREKQIEERRRQASALRARRPTGRAAGEVGMEEPAVEGGGATPRQGLIKPQQTRTPRRNDKDKKRTQLRKERDAAESISLQDIDEELQNILLTESTEVSNNETLIFWAHDDTVEAGETYRYRLRLGVFNPIAGKEQVIEQDEWQKDKVILWSEFSEPSEAVEIPPKLCFFARDIQDAAKTVIVTVSRYTLGYWYSEDFMVKAGENIGNVVKLEPPEETTGQLTIPEQIDYSTGAVLIDVVPVDDWSVGTTPYKRYNMLYSFDGTSIKHMAIKQRYWPEKLQTMYAEIRKAEKEPKQPLRAFGSRITERRVGPFQGPMGIPDTERMDDE